MLRIGNKIIDYKFNPFIVAEIGINHNGDIDIARQLIDEAIVADCDAVKFQKRTPELCVPERQKNLIYETPWGTMTYLEYRKRVEFGEKEYGEINRYCKQRGIMWFASPWDEESVDFLEKYDPPCFKIASACNLDRDLMAYIKSKKRPIIVSTGMTDDVGIEHIVRFLGEESLVILHCTATYPAKDSELHLANIPKLIKKYPRAFIGYSGHEVGIAPSLVAATLGACVIERHITLDRAMWGTNQAASLELIGLKRLTRDLRSLHTRLGEPKKKILESEKPLEAKLRRKNTLF